MHKAAKLKTEFKKRNKKLNIDYANIRRNSVQLHITKQQKIIKIIQINKNNNYFQFSNVFEEKNNKNVQTCTQLKAKSK